MPTNRWAVSRCRPHRQSQEAAACTGGRSGAQNVYCRRGAKVLANLLREGVSIRDMASILEILGDYGNITRYRRADGIRAAEAEAITRSFIPTAGRGDHHNPKPKRCCLKPAARQGGVAIEPAQMQRFGNLKGIDHFLSLGISPMVITSPMIRRQVKNLSAQICPELVVLSYNELEPNVEILSDWTVTF